MSVSEEERHELYLALEAAHGRDKANTLMSLLPPVGWADVAAKTDLQHLENRMDAEFTRVRAEMTAGFADVRAEMATGFADLRTEIANSRADQRTQLILLFVALVGLQVSGAGVALALRQIL